MKRLLIAGVVLAATFAGVGPVLADPVDDTLEIDGTPIITRTAAPEGHPFDELYSGWLFRESETRDLSRDSFENPGMIAVEDGEAMWNTVMKTHAQAFYTAKALGVLDKVHQPIFDAINLERNMLQNEKSLAALFAKHGVDEERFSKVFNSFAVKSQVEQADARARGYGISGTPEMVVNGKYRVSTRTAGGQREMLKVVEHLVEQERNSSL